MVLPSGGFLPYGRNDKEKLVEMTKKACRNDKEKPVETIKKASSHEALARPLNFRAPRSFLGWGSCEGKIWECPHGPCSPIGYMKAG